MTRLDLTLKMTGADGSESIEYRTVEIQDHPTPARCTASFTFVTRSCASPPETKRCPGKTSERLVEILGQAREHHALFDIRNAQTMWLELSNLIIGAEADLVLSQTFKALEPAQ